MTVIRAILGKPSPTNVTVFFNIFRRGWSNPCSKDCCEFVKRVLVLVWGLQLFFGFFCSFWSWSNSSSCSSTSRRIIVAWPTLSLPPNIASWGERPIWGQLKTSGKCQFLRRCDNCCWGMLKIAKTFLKENIGIYLLSKEFFSSTM